MGSENGQNEKTNQGKKPKLKASSPVESPISIIGKFPCGQVNFPLDVRHLIKR
jgi:hypothetical protein